MSLIYNIRERIWQKRRRENDITLPRSGHMPIVPTKFGLAFGALLLIMFIWSINHQLNLGYALVFLNFIIAAFAAALTVTNLSHLHLSIGDATPVFAGEIAHIPIHLRDNSNRPRPALTIANREYSAECDGIDANSSATITLPQRAKARGWQPTEPLEIRTSLPLNLFVTWQWIHPIHKHLVYPAPKGEQPIPRINSEKNGEHLAEGLGDDELTHLAPYRNGDPLSRVAWKQLGRGDMMIKRFAGQGSDNVILDYAHANGDHETRLSQLAKWIIEAETAGMNYQLKLPHYQSPSAQGKRHYHQCLQQLAETP